PAVDSYPRVMVGRLRSLLDRYYSEKPWLRRLRVPQGSYEIVVQQRAAPPSSRAADAVDAVDEGARESAAPDAAAPPAGGAVPSSTSLLPPVPRPRAGWMWIGFVVALLLAALAGWLAARSDGRLLGADFAPMPTIEVSQPI